MDRLCQSENNTAKLTGLFGLIIVVIAVMGVYGLIVFNARYRAEEIAIRKVNGSSNREIMLLLNRTILIRLADSLRRSDSHCVLHRLPMAAKLRLQDAHRLVGLPARRHHRTGNNRPDRQRPELPGRLAKPDKSAEQAVRTPTCPDFLPKAFETVYFAAHAVRKEYARCMSSFRIMEKNTASHTVHLANNS